MFPKILDAPKFLSLAQEKQKIYQSAHPFPHIIIDNFLSQEYLDHVLSEFPSPEGNWIKRNDPREVKLASQNERTLGDYTRYLIYELNSSLFLRFLETLTGMEGLISDPHLEGGGLHQIVPGGFLKIHADFNRYEKLRLDRRINLLLYLNKDWKEEYGGHLELWDKSMTKPVQKVLPLFNRCVIFSTTSWSYHGHPEPLTCPPPHTRKSLALYYYTNGRPLWESSGKPHSTLFQKRPGEHFPEAKKKRSIRPKRLFKKLFPSLFIK